MSIDQLKLNKQILNAMRDQGYRSPKELQELTISRIVGGQDILNIGPEGSGKTTTMILGTIMRLKHAFEDAPRALILTHSREAIESLEEQFNIFAKNTDLRILGIAPGGGVQGQKDLISDGVDIVISTPDRVNSLLIHYGINLNRLKIFILDDTELIIKQGFQAPVRSIAEGLPKCQHLVYTEVYHDKIKKMVDFFMKYPHQVEIKEEFTNAVDCIPQTFYHVPNFATKLNLINKLAELNGCEEKTIVFVNTRLTASKVYQRLSTNHTGKIAIYQPMLYDQVGVDDIEQFVNDDDLKLLIIANEVYSEEINHEGLKHLIHFDIPFNPEAFVNRTELQQTESTTPSSTLFASDLELSDVQKIEHIIGASFEPHALPTGLLIEGTSKKDRKKSASDTDGFSSGAFHEKSEKNSKQFNITTKDKLKVRDKKKKHRRKKN